MPEQPGTTPGSGSLFAFFDQSEDRQFATWECGPCGGYGWFGWGGCSRVHACEECDGTGRKYRAIWTTEDGVTCSMTGSGATPPDANTRALMEMVARAATGAAS